MSVLHCHAGCAGAVAAASPSGVNLSPIVEMWTTALRAGRTGKEAALHAALGVLSSPSPPSASAPTGVFVLTGWDPSISVGGGATSMTSAICEMYCDCLTRTVCFYCRRFCGGAGTGSQ